LLLETGEDELLQRAGGHPEHFDRGQGQDRPASKASCRQDDVVNQIARDERLGKAKQRRAKDEESAQRTGAPVPGDVRLQVVETGPHAEVTRGLRCGRRQPIVRQRAERPASERPTWLDFECAGHGALCEHVIL